MSCHVTALTRPCVSWGQGLNPVQSSFPAMESQAQGVMGSTGPDEVGMQVGLHLAESPPRPVRAFGSQPPSREPAESLQRARWHQQIQGLERVFQPPCIGEES